MKNGQAQLVGVGSVLSRGIVDLMHGKNFFSIDDFVAVVQKLLAKSDLELGGGIYASYEVSNALLALGFMKGLNIKQIEIMDVNNAEGALVYKPFWK